MTGQDSKYFLSYSREDSPFVLRLAKELRNAGASVWVDQLDIVGGERWDEAIERALRSCPGLVLILSPDSVTSQTFMDEVSYALEERRKVIPLLYRECDIPFRLRRLQRIDLTGDYQRGFRQLCRALGVGSESAVATTGGAPVANETQQQRETGGESRGAGAGVGAGAEEGAGKSPTGTVARWRLAVLAAALAPLYLASISETCFNADWVALSVLIGLPLALFIRWRRPRSSLWLLIPGISAMIGFPYGHAHGMISRSPLFGFQVGEQCQQFSETYAILFGLLAAVAVLDFFLIRRAYRPRDPS